MAAVEELALEKGLQGSVTQRPLGSWGEWEHLFLTLPLGGAIILLVYRWEY